MNGAKQKRNTRKLTEDEQTKVIENLELVHYVLQKQLHLRPHLDCYQDYFQEGCIGLIHAVVRFDESLGFALSTLAIPYIRGHLQRYRRSNITMLHVSRPMSDKYYEVIKLQNQGYSIDEIPEKMGISSLELLDIVNTYSMSSLNYQVEIGKDESAVEMGDLISDWKNCYEDLLFEQSFDESLKYVLSLRHEPSKSICEEWVYTNMFGEKLSQSYFAEKYHMSQCHISRILKKFKDDLVFYLELRLE